MWRLRTERGRQWWECEAGAAGYGSHNGDAVEELAEVEAARARYRAQRHRQKHASDALLRIHALRHPAGGATGKELDDEAAKSAAGSGADAAVTASLRRGFTYFSKLQQPDGHFAGDYGGPMFLLPGLVITCYVTGTPLGEARTRELRRYLYNLQNEHDGGWGLHIEAASGMFGTVLSYVSLRLLGADPDEASMRRARAFIHRHGTALATPSWGKFWLACLGCYDWRGMNPLTPEMWLLPYGSGDASGETRPAIGWLANPVMPARYWCHCRVVYLPMSYVYGRRGTGAITPLVRALRVELYAPTAAPSDDDGAATPSAPLSSSSSSGGSESESEWTPAADAYYDTINWPAHRDNCCPLDEYTQRPRVQKLLWHVLSAFEWATDPITRRLRDKWLRPRALTETLDQIKQEDRNTNFICIGPVNKAVNMLAAWLDAPDSAHFRAHQERVKDYLWIAEDGMKMQGYNGSQLWDTAFAVQAYTEAGALTAARDSAYRKTIEAAYRYLEMTQVPHNVPQMRRYYRHISKGAWPFSTRDHGWPITDCTAEGVKATLAVHRVLASHAGNDASLPHSSQIDVSLLPRVTDDRLDDALNVMLSFQNPDGGWATYENTRSYPWIEALNPSEVFGDIMVDYSYVECSSAVITALVEFRAAYPRHARNAEVSRAIARGVDFVRNVQRADGSWYGSWGVSFTYGTWFGVEALVAAGATLDTSPALERACAFLAAHEHAGGDAKHGAALASGANGDVKRARNRGSGGYGDDGEEGDHSGAAGGWGESYLSCSEKTYHHADTPQCVNTAWALLSLLAARWHTRGTDEAALVHRAARCLMRMQCDDGDWPQQLISGVFNRNCMISYSNYRNVFPLWALARYRNEFADAA